MRSNATITESRTVRESWLQRPLRKTTWYRRQSIRYWTFAPINMHQAASAVTIAWARTDSRSRSLESNTILTGASWAIGTTFSSGRRSITKRMMSMAQSRRVKKRLMQLIEKMSECRRRQVKTSLSQKIARRHYQIERKRSNCRPSSITLSTPRPWPQLRQSSLLSGPARSMHLKTTHLFSSSRWSLSLAIFSFKLSLNLWHLQALPSRWTFSAFATNKLSPRMSLRTVPLPCYFTNWAQAWSCLSRSWPSSLRSTLYRWRELARVKFGIKRISLTRSRSNCANIKRIFSSVKRNLISLSKWKS